MTLRKNDEERSVRGYISQQPVDPLRWFPLRQLVRLALLIKPNKITYFRIHWSRQCFRYPHFLIQPRPQELHLLLH